MAAKHQLLGGPFTPATTNTGLYTPRTGTNFNLGPVGFVDSASDQLIYFEDKAHDYGGGNLSLIIDWYPASTTSGTVRFISALAAYTPETDTQDVETKAFATAQSIDDAHLGTTAKRIMRTTLTISNLDSLANDDLIFLKFGRECSHANDTFTGITIFVEALWLTWS